MEEKELKEAQAKFEQVAMEWAGFLSGAMERKSLTMSPFETFMLLKFSDLNERVKRLEAPSHRPQQMIKVP